MAHELDNNHMVYAQGTDVPWHGLGDTFPPDTPPAEVLKRAKLDWRVEKRSLTYVCSDGSPRTVEGKAALVRDYDGKLMDIVGKDWKPHQNEDTFKIFDKYVKIGGATMETAGALRGGEIVWGLANLKHGFKTPRGDEIKGYILLMGSHKFGKATLMQTTAVRVVCMNTLRLAMQGQAELVVRVNHGYEFNADIVEQQFGLAHEAIDEFNRNAAVLTKLNLSQEDAMRILQPTYQPMTDIDKLINGETQPNNPMNMILTSIVNAPGADPGTAWGVLNGVTYYADHMAGRTQDTRLTSSWMGTEAKRKDDVVARLLRVANEGLDFLRTPEAV